MNNNRLSKELTPSCAVVLDRSSKKILSILQQGWCCKDNELAEATSIQCNEREGTFFVDHEKALQSCRASVTEEVEKGWCCVNAELSRISQRACLEKGGQYFTDSSAAEDACLPKESVPEEPQRGWCCINGDLSEMLAEECWAKKGTLYTEYDFASSQCQSGKTQVRTRRLLLLSGDSAGNLFGEMSGKRRNIL